MALHPCKQGEFNDTLFKKQRHDFLALDTRWAGVGARMGDHELEEGEACDDPDSGCDPDTAFAYLDKKLVMVLGDVQKDFEGGVSAEKLGSKFGGYGSFLPTHERAPSILYQEKPSSIVASDAYGRAKKSPNEGIVEKMKRTAAGSSVGVSNSKACSGSALLVNENGGRDAGPTNEKTSNAASSFPAPKVEENAGPLKKVTLRIKMGSDTNERKKNAAIYNDLGLVNSSSASDDCDDEDQRSDSDLDSSPDRTPLTMIRIMTSHHIPDGMLLSPLGDLVAEPFIQKEMLWSTNREGLGEKTRSPYPIKADVGYELGLIKDDEDPFEKVENLKDNNVSFDHMWKKAKAEKGKGESSKESGKHVLKPPLKAFGRDLSKLNENGIERQEKDAASESGTGVRSMDLHRESKGSFFDQASSEYPLGEAEHVPKDFSSSFEPLKAVDSSREPPSRGHKVEKAAASSSHDRMKEQCDDMGHHVRDVGKEVSSMEMGMHGKRQLEINMELVDSKKRSAAKESAVLYEGKTNTSQDAKKAVLKSSVGGKFVLPTTDISATSRELGKEVTKVRKSSKESVKEAHASRGSSKEKGKGAFKEARESLGKDKHTKETSCRDVMKNETVKEGHHHSFKTGLNKDLQQRDQAKGHKKESMEPLRKEKPKERIKSDFPSKDPSRLSEKDRQKDSALRDVPMKSTQSSLQASSFQEAVGSDKPSELGLLPPSSVGNTLPGPVTVITENWVACDECEKWRLLPPGVETEHLPKKWRCKMLYWLTNMNNCNVLEEVTTQATQVLYNNIAPPLPPIQADPSAAEHIQPPANLVAVLPPTCTNVGISSQEIRVSDKNKVAVSKKRKVPPTASNEPVNGKSKGLADALQMIQEGSQAKLGSGDSQMTQEGNEAKLGSVDSGHVQAGEEKRKVKEREKTKRYRPNDGASPLGKEHGLPSATLAMGEARNLKRRADRLEGKIGMERERTGVYLQAALKFLQAASMKESEGAEHGENIHPLKIYADAARLCEFCAVDYEHRKDHAAAALAYKCAGLARMRVVQANSLCINRDRAEVQSAHQQVAPGESPSSLIASDVDNLNNLTMDRLPSRRGAASPSSNSQMGGTFMIPAKVRPSFNKILQYVGETTAAMEVLSKSYNAFATAESASLYSSEGMTALKRFLDFSFHDVESSVRLARVAMEAMGH